MVSGEKVTSAVFTAIPDPAQHSIAKTIAMYGSTFFILHERVTLTKRFLPQKYHYLVREAIAEGKIITFYRYHTKYNNLQDNILE